MLFRNDKFGYEALFVASSVHGNKDCVILSDGAQYSRTALL